MDIKSIKYATEYLAKCGLYPINQENSVCGNGFVNAWIGIENPFGCCWQMFNQNNT